MKGSRTRDLVCGTVLLAVWLGVWLPRLAGPIDLRWDASTYYILGTSLAEGKGYRLLNEPGEIEAIQYPPLLPLIVAAHQVIMRTHDYFIVGTALRFFYFAISGVYLITVYALARQLLSPVYALLVGVITAFSFYSFIHPSNTLYAELPFALISTLFLLCQCRSDRPLYAWIAGVLGVGAYLLRAAGLALLASWTLESVFRRRFRQAAIRMAVSALPILLWQIHVWRVIASDEYHQPAYAYQRAPYYYANVTYQENSSLVDPFRPELGRNGLSDIARRVVRNAAVIPTSIGESALFPINFGPILLIRLYHAFAVPVGSPARTLCSLALSGSLPGAGLIAIAGAIFVATGRHWFLSLYAAVTLGLVIITPWQSQFWRYLAPLAPLMVVFLILALLTITHWVDRRSSNSRSLTGLLVLGATLAGILLVQISTAWFLFRIRFPVSYYDAAGCERRLQLLTYDGGWHSFDGAFEWVRRHVPADEVIATSIPHLAYLRTGHKAVLPPFDPDVESASRLLDEVPVKYLVIDQLARPGISERYAAPIVARKTADWHLVFTATDNRTRVYERTR
jgi:hypothetical protein